MIVAALEGGIIMRYLKEQDSSKIAYNPAWLSAEGAGEVHNLLVSPYSNHFIVIAEDHKLFNDEKGIDIKIGRAFDFLDKDFLLATN